MYIEWKWGSTEKHFACVFVAADRIKNEKADSELEEKCIAACSHENNYHIRICHCMQFLLLRDEYNFIFG